MERVINLDALVSVEQACWRHRGSSLVCALRCIICYVRAGMGLSLSPPSPTPSYAPFSRRYLNRLALRNARPMTAPLHMHGAESLRHRALPPRPRSRRDVTPPLAPRSAPSVCDDSAHAGRGLARKLATKHSCA